MVLLQGKQSAQMKRPQPLTHFSLKKQKWAITFPADTALVQEKYLLVCPWLADRQLLGVYHTKNTFIFWHGAALLKYQRPWLIKWSDGTERFDDKI